MTRASRHADLDHVFDLTLAAVDLDGLRQALLQLVVWVRDDEASATERAQLVRLVRDAARLLSNQNSLGWGSDVSDWLHEAMPFVKAPER